MAAASDRVRIMTRIGRRIGYRIIAMANSTARTATAIATGQKLSLGVLFTGLYCRTLKPVLGKPALT